MRYSRTVKLKNSRACLIRNAVGDDAKAVCDSFTKAHGETDFLLTYPDEHRLTVDEERAFLIEKEESVNEIEICADLDGKIVGTAGISAVGRREKVRHRAEFGISVEKAYWGQGIGRALTDACIECAKAAGYVQLELDVVADNEKAISLYKSVGFTEFGRNPKGFRSRITGWQEVVLMRLELSED